MGEEREGGTIDLGVHKQRIFDKPKRSKQGMCKNTRDVPMEQYR